MTLNGRNCTNTYTTNNQTVTDRQTDGRTDKTALAHTVPACNTLCYKNDFNLSTQAN